MLEVGRSVVLVVKTLKQKFQDHSLFFRYLGLVFLSSFFPPLYLSISHSHSHSLTHSLTLEDFLRLFFLLVCVLPLSKLLSV